MTLEDTKTTPLPVKVDPTLGGRTHTGTYEDPPSLDEIECYIGRTTSVPGNRISWDTMVTDQTWDRVIYTYLTTFIKKTNEDIVDE